MIVAAAGLAALLGLAVAAGAGLARLDAAERRIRELLEERAALLTALHHVRGELCDRCECGYIRHIDGAASRLEGPWASP